MKRRLHWTIAIASLAVGATVAAEKLHPWRIASTAHFLRSWSGDYVPAARADTPAERAFVDALDQAALDRTQQIVRYDPKYVAIPYPGGDFPADTGVCSDEVTRSYRRVNVDLQQLVHEDMRQNFALYPKLWGLSAPDSSIDHRRVPNLMQFFLRHGAARKFSSDGADYLPGDLVVWRLASGVVHIGLFTSQRSSDGERPLIVHNIGAGPQLEDGLFMSENTGHFRYRPEGLFAK
jgi:uncharacterized protein YijF (DUF1287 family)